MSREKQIEELTNELVFTSNYGTYDAVANYLINKGYRKQSVGEWVKVMNHRECSKCGYNAPYKKIKAGYHLQDLANYCPNCGAKMKGGAE